MNLYKTYISPKVVLTFVGVFRHNLEFFDQSIQFLGKGAHLFLLTTMLQNGFVFVDNYGTSWVFVPDQSGLNIWEHAYPSGALFVDS